MIGALKPILVTGATGNVGLGVVQGLLEAAVPVRVGEYSLERARAVFENKVQYVRLDFTDPRTYGPALAGLEQVFLMRPPQIAQARYFRSFVQAAKEAGVRQVVFLSLLGAEKNRVVPHRKIEDLILEAGIPHVFLRPSFFMQNLSTTHAQDVKNGEILVPAGQGKTSFIDARDISAVAVRALLERHQNVAYDLTGNEALTYREVAETFSEVLGREVRYANPGIVQFALHMRRQGFAWPFIGVMVGIYSVARFGRAGRVTDTVQELLGRPPIRLRQFVQDYRQVWT